MSGAASETALYAALAGELGLEFAPEPREIVLCRADRPIDPGARTVMVRRGDAAHWVLAPRTEDVDALIAHAGHASDTAPPATIVTPSTMRDLIARTRETAALERAVHALHRAQPEGSARTVMTARQGFVLASLVAGLGAGMVLAPTSSLLGLHGAATLSFGACIGLRALAATSAKPPRYAPLAPVAERDLPVYSVLAVLYREAPVVPQLIAHLDRLKWPRAKLDIQLVCEVDDRETLDAIAAHGLPPHMRIVRVPGESPHVPGGVEIDCGPRTKPKALNHALDGALGEFVVVYDAEDRPHPYQLREAHAAFRDGPDDLGCLQAALQIDNGRRSFLSRGFAMEYAALFRGLLPWLAVRRLPLPLEGTSNHFRVRALQAVGAWDPFNVTEDADLGFRLFRAGWRVGTIQRPTIEAAPETWRVWRNQRTRWLKGWAQTWLVHMRSPARLWREAGPGGFAMLQIAMLGILGSALLHPLMFVTLASVLLAATADVLPSGTAGLLLAIDASNIVLGYAAMWALTRAVLRPTERWLLKGAWWRLPLYWLHLVPPAWRAIGELLYRPHHWSKTPHAPSVPPDEHG